MKTRQQERHEGIRKVHPLPLVRRDKKTLREKHKKQMETLRRERERSGTVQIALTEYLQEYGVVEFVIGCFMGTIVTRKGDVTRREAISLLDHSKSFRGLVSRLWRNEDAHNHEWVPCTYMSEIIVRALRAQNFTFIKLAKVMRTPTRNILFKPLATNSIVATTAGRVRTTYSLLQAHPGGLKLRMPNPPPLGQTSGSLRNGSAMFRGSTEFHDAIIEALEDPGTPADLVTALRGVYVNWGWDGSLAHAGAPAAIGTVWPYYKLGNGTDVTLWTPGVAAPAMPHAAVQAIYNGVLAQFTAWEGIARAPRRTDDYSL
jgi:hypothetical protein